MKDPKKVAAGRKGGLMTKKRHGANGHFSEIGKKGGKKGGEQTKARYGRDFYVQNGMKGGRASWKKTKRKDNA